MADGGASLFYFAAAASAAVGGYSAYQQGIVQKGEYEAQARQEQMAARDREIQRRQQLLKVLASRSVAVGAGGGTFEGTPTALVQGDFRNYSLDQASASANTAATVTRLRTAGRNAKTIGKLNAAASLIDAGGSFVKGINA